MFSPRFVSYMPPCDVASSFLCFVLALVSYVPP